MNPAWAAVAGVLVAAISSVTAWLTSKASAKGAVKAATVTSLSDLEREAGERAARIYNGAIARLEQERDEDRAEREKERAQDQAEIRGLREDVAAARAETADVRRELRRCKDACLALTKRMDSPPAS